MISTTRFILKPLIADDISDEYVSWFVDDDVKKHIHFAQNNVSLLDLELYVRQREEKNYVLLLGIYVKETLLHIGNIKFEPIDHVDKTAVMGILIGDKDWRGKGVAKEVIDASADWINYEFKIKKILLVLNIENSAAINAYKKCGFNVGEHQYSLEDPTSISMIRHI